MTLTNWPLHVTPSKASCKEDLQTTIHNRECTHSISVTASRQPAATSSSATTIDSKHLGSSTEFSDNQLTASKLSDNQLTASKLSDNQLTTDSSAITSSSEVTS